MRFSFKDESLGIHDEGMGGEGQWKIKGLEISRSRNIAKEKKKP